MLVCRNLLLVPFIMPANFLTVLTKSALHLFTTLPWYHRGLLPLPLYVQDNHLNHRVLLPLPLYVQDNHLNHLFLLPLYLSLPHLHPKAW